MLTGWWRRVGATVVDGLLIGIPVSIVFGAIGIAGYALSGIDDVALLLYQILLLGMPAGQTIGNRAVTSRVIDATTGGPIGPGRATARQLVQLVLNLTIIGGILDVFWPLWDRRNQTLHDKAANSLVVMAY